MYQKQARKHSYNVAKDTILALKQVFTPNITLSVLAWSCLVLKTPV